MPYTIRTKRGLYLLKTEYTEDFGKTAFHIYDLLARPPINQTLLLVGIALTKERVFELIQILERE